MRSELAFAAQEEALVKQFQTEVDATYGDILKAKGEET